jgi:lipoic acid synthetase
MASATTAPVAGSSPATDPLRVRWLGRVPYGEAFALQRALWRHGTGNHLLLLEHPHTYTLGANADPANVLVDPATVGAALVRTDRGGDVTYHGPGQLVGYPIVGVRGPHAKAYVRSVEHLLIDALADLGVRAGRLDDYPGVWVDHDGPDPRKIAAIGVRISKGRTFHGFALNVTTDLAMFGHIVPCGIPDKGVTSLAAEGVTVSMAQVVDAVVARAARRFGDGTVDRQDVAWRADPAGRDLSAFSRGEGPGRSVRPDEHGTAGDAPVELPSPSSSVRLTGRLADAGVTTGLAIATRKPDWLRVKADMRGQFLEVKKTVRELGLVTVCEEAGCPNIHECWNDGTATFMVLGERCTRACGFCLVDTRKPLAAEADEPARVAEAVARMGLRHAVLTMVARDDLPDGGMAHVAACVEAIRARTPGTRIETLISDARGDHDALAVLFAAAPDVLNHNIETVPRLQRAVRPSAGYARSLGVLSAAKAAGLTTKSGFVLGMGETDDEVLATLADLAAIGCDIVTIGQYLRPTTNHLPVHRWVPPEQFAVFKAAGEAMGITHVESSPLTRSSYHARSAADAASVTPVPAAGASFT